MKNPTMRQTSHSHRTENSRHLCWLVPLLLLLLIPAASTPLQASIPNTMPGELNVPLTGPDLAVTEIRLVPANPQAGDTIDVTVVVQNIGDQVAPAGFRTNIYVNPSDDPPTADTRRTVSVFRGEATDPGETFELAGTNIELTNDNPVIYVWVDAANQVAEADETNNLVRYPVTDEPTPSNPDPFEPDNDCTNASDIAVGGAPQEHNLTSTTEGTKDIDWVKFDAVRGRNYVVEIIAVGDDADLFAGYYAFCNNGGSLFPGNLRFTIQSDQNSPYYVSIEHDRETHGPDTGYTIQITLEGTPTPPATSTPPPDSYENDNNCTDASPITVGGAAQDHNLTSSTEGTKDVDWVMFNAARGRNYVVEIIPATPNDVVLYAEYYGFCSDNGSLGGALRFTIQSDQNSPYFVNIQSDRDPTGPDTGYTIQITLEGTPTPTPTVTPVPDNTPCRQATQITPGEIPQESTFEAALDIDWYTFQATANADYRVTVEIPDGSRADVNLEIYPGCVPGPTTNWRETFAPGAQVDFTAANNGPIYLRLVNADDNVGGPEWRYRLSVRQLNQESKGAVIIVAGRLKLNDHLQDNIYAVTDRVFTIFQRQGRNIEDIYYLSPEAEKVVHYDASATIENVGNAITNWAATRLQEEDGPDVLTLYMMDHGGIDKFYLDGPRGEILTPTQLDDFLDTLEQKVPGIKINVIIEACHAGSFIQQPGSISAPNRVIVTSSDEENEAYASSGGAIFSDQFLTSLQRGGDLYSSWLQASDIVANLFVVFPQRPWIDGDGDGIHNEQDDFRAASVRSFARRSLTEDSTLWPPYIARVPEPEATDGNGVAISAEVRDNQGVSHVWAIIYPPSYTPPTRGSEDEMWNGEDDNLERIVLDHKGDGIYRGRAYNFTRTGVYRIVIHADDADEQMARPVVVEYNHTPVPLPGGELRVYLPYVSR